jgi:hypothetical protein
MIGPATLSADDRLAQYLGDIAAALRGPRRRRQRVLAELREGVEQAAIARTAPGVPREQALAAAIEEFGRPAAIATAFDPEMAIADARRILTWLLVTGPLVGIWWLLLLHPRPWSAGVAALLAAIPVLPLIAIAVAVAAATFAATGRLTRWIPEAAPGTALTAVSGVAVVVLAGDITILAVAWPQASAEPVGVAAIAASSARVACSLRILRRAATWRHRPAFARSRPALLEALLQRGHVRRHLLASLAPHHERDEELADPVAGEVDGDGQT